MKGLGLSFLTLFLLLGAVPALQKAYITVKGSNLNSGVVTLDIQMTGKDYALRCNQRAPGCTALKNGRYQLIELPQGFGMYECRDVEVYAESLTPSDALKPDRPSKPNKDDRLGEYCLVEKQG